MYNEINLSEIYSVTNQAQSSLDDETVQSSNPSEFADAVKDLANRAQNTEKGNNKPEAGYRMGRSNGKVREIPAGSVMAENKPPKTINIGGVQLTVQTNSAGQPSRYSNTTDNYIGDTSQGRRGDCYLLAEINAIRNTKDGQKVLTQNLKKNNDGSYTVKLPGALKVRRQYEAKGLPCEVTGTYHISKAALDKAGNSEYYSNGDLEVVAFELAMEAFRAEMYMTNKQNGTVGRFGTVESTISPQNIRDNNGDLLRGGFTHDAGFVLTGQKSNVFYAKKDRYENVTPYKAGKYGYISREEMARRTNADISMYSEKAGIGISEFSHYTSNEQAINSMLNEYQGKEGQYALTFGVRVAKDGPDGSTYAGDGHAIAVVKITRDTVYIANSWDSDQIEPIPRNEFIKMTTSLVATPIKAPSTGSQKPNNPQYINALRKFISKQ